MNSTRPVLIIFVCSLLFQPIQAGWARQDAGTLAWLRSVYFTNEKAGWIVGSNGTYLATQDGGKNWRKAGNITKDNILDVYFSDVRNGWLLCEGDKYIGNGMSSSYLMETTDGGENWRRVNLSAGPERPVRFVFSKIEGFAVGEGGVIWRMQIDKKTWGKSMLPVRYLMLGGTFTSDSRGLLIGGRGTILLTEDGGSSWTSAPVPYEDKPKLNSVVFSNDNTGWTVGTRGKIYFTNNGGKTWREQASNVTRNLSDVFFINDSEGFVVGDNGTILHTTTAGDTWNVEETASKHKLERVFFAGKHGFAVGFGGTILSVDLGR